MRPRWGRFKIIKCPFSINMRPHWGRTKFLIILKHPTSPQINWDKKSDFVIDIEIKIVSFFKEAQRFKKA
jgi:hypothetical protein